MALPKKIKEAIHWIEVKYPLFKMHNAKSASTFEMHQIMEYVHGC